MEVEVRAKVDDLSSIRSRLEEMGAVFGKETRQADRIFKRRGEEKKEQGPGDFILRVRDNHKKKFTFKGLTETTGAWEEHEVEIDDAEEMIKILERTGFAECLAMTKRRIIGKLDDFEVCLDDIKELGTYIEVELGSDNAQEAKDMIMGLLKKLGIDESNVEHKGYVALLFEKQGVVFKGTG